MWAVGEGESWLGQNESEEEEKRTTSVEKSGEEKDECFTE